MRCPDCNKFVAFEENDPEVELDVDDDGMVTGTVRIVNACAECGSELKEATLDVEGSVEEEIVKCKGDPPDEEKDCPLSIEETSSGRTSRAEGKGRGTKTFYGAEVEYEVTCECGKIKVTKQWSDDVQASSMDEMV